MDISEQKIIYSPDCSFDLRNFLDLYVSTNVLRRDSPYFHDASVHGTF